jgi:uncharacterized membrane protein YhiD involved in acid resistance
MSELLRALEGADIAIPDYSLSSIFLSLLLAFVLGQLVAWMYSFTHAGLSYSRSFTQSLVLMTMLVALVMFVIGNSIIAAFGLLGALAIIRFRNVLKDTRDTVFVFLSLVIGMACGTQRYLTAVFGTAIILLVAVYLWWTGFGTFGRFDGYLSLRTGGGAGGEFLDVLRRFCRSTKQISKHQAPGEGTEYVFQVGLRNRAGSNELLEALNRVDGVENVSLVLRDELAEV